MEDILYYIKDERTKESIKDTVAGLAIRYGESLQYIGLKGSHVLRLADKDSDIDLLVVVANAKNDYIKTTEGDYQIVNVGTFVRSIVKMDITAIEAFFSPIVMSNKFESLYEQIDKGLCSVMKHGYGDDLFRQNLIEATKNKYRQYNNLMKSTSIKQRGNHFVRRRNKILSKIFLYFTLSRDAFPLYHYSVHGVSDVWRDRYLKLRHGEDAMLMEILFDKNIYSLPKTTKDDLRFARWCVAEHFTKFIPIVIEQT